MIFNSLLILAAVTIGLATTSCTKCSNDSKESSAESPSSSPAATADATELKIEVLKQGSGVEATSGKKVTVHYTGKLTDGKVFDSSEQRQVPFPFTLGSGQVIPGWEKGVEGMKIGERRRLTIPAKMGYGDRGVGNVIPPNATLVFEVELLNVE